MTKTLTEQWKDGELELNSLWFVRLPSGRYDKCFYTGSIIFMKSIHGYDEKIKQVLDKVPFYEEYKKLKKQLADASKTIGRLKEQLEIARIVLGQIAMFSSDKADAVQCAKAIKDMSEVE